MSGVGYSSPVNPIFYTQFAMLFIVIGVFFTGVFFAYEFTTDVNSRNSKRSKSLLKELVLGFIASVFLGIGSLFVFLSAGLYV